MSTTMRLLPKAMAEDELLSAIAAIADRWDGFNGPIEELFLRNIDDLPMAFVRYLAWQYHVDGWSNLLTDAARREAVRHALQLTRRRGTPWAITEAMRIAGYGGAVITEGLPQLLYDGDRQHDGSEAYEAGARWARFQVRLDLGEDRGLTESEIAQINRAIAAYKNERSHLDQIVYEADVTDDVDASDATTTTATVEPVDVRPAGLRHDGAESYDHAIFLLADGSISYDGEHAHAAYETTGAVYDTEWDTQETSVSVSPPADSAVFALFYDGRYPYVGGDVTHATASVTDGDMLVTATRHRCYDGILRHALHIYDGSASWDGAIDYEPDGFYAGHITEEDVA